MMLHREPVKWAYPNNAGSGCIITPVLPTANRDIQQDMHQLADKLQDFDVTINHDLPKRLRGYLKERLHVAQKQQLRLIHRYLKEIERLTKILTNVRHGSPKRAVRGNVESILEELMNELTEHLEDLDSKARFIHELKKQNFRYYNVANYDPHKNDNGKTLERKLIKDSRRDRILCSNNTLNGNNQSKLDNLLRQLADEGKTNSNLRLIYADFSYCTFELSDMMILPSSKLSPSQPIAKEQSDTINILLLGETGVGKSTFINAFVNYLTFDTLQQAEIDKPVALIPVSFLLTTGDNFEEHHVKFGDFSSSNNEDFNHPGQSVTQHCKTHRFDLKQMFGKQLCIIDTPGFGDTRGLDQDDANMQHILKYISTLSHLNAVCFLLKPNSSRLHIFFQTCLTQLLNLLGPNARQNIIFCFTNARSTAYTPGDTAPLLRTALNSLSVNDIPFKKENTFCFDNESFRYLVALQNGIRFDNDDRNEYETSWKISVKESTRLLEYIYTQLNIYPLQNEWQPNESAEVQINYMIRPMLEGMRNILRNLILSKTDSPNKTIELHSEAIHQPTAFCLSCKRHPFPLNNFWILPDYPHACRNQCLTCACEFDQHMSVDYLLSYDTVNNSSHYPQSEMSDMLDQLCLASAEFATFLVDTRSIKLDPFHVGLTRMISEEQHICAEKDSKHLNLQLVNELEKLTAKYQEQMKQIQLNHKQLDSQVIYGRIKTIGSYPIIREQLTAIRQTRAKNQDE